MKQRIKLNLEFVESVPEKMAERTLYVSIPYATVMHLCCCGCEHEVVTPLSPTDWSLRFDGKTVSLDPSIGNWGFKCRSHYWIRNNCVLWAESWSDEEIQRTRRYDAMLKEEYYKEQAKSVIEKPLLESQPVVPAKPKRSLWSRLLMVLRLKKES